MTQRKRLDDSTLTLIEKSDFFSDKGQKKHYERRRRQFLRSVKRLMSIWGAERVVSDIRDVYYDVLHRLNVVYMSD